MDDIFSDALTYTRTLVADLSPAVLRDHGLATALQWLGNYMQKHGQTVSVTVPEDQEFKLPEDECVLLFQSVRELLINSAKHAGTGQATLMMGEQDGNVCITVRDEGKASIRPLRLRVFLVAESLQNMACIAFRKRMRAIGGSVTIDSAPGQGTTAS